MTTSTYLPLAAQPSADGGSRSEAGHSARLRVGAAGSLFALGVLHERRTARWIGAETPRRAWFAGGSLLGGFASIAPEVAPLSPPFVVLRNRYSIRQSSPALYVRELVEAGRVTEARRILELLPWSGDPSLSHWRRVLALPTVRRVPARGSEGVAAQIEWVRLHGHEYRGEWVLLRGGDLIDHSPNRAEIRRRLSDSGQTLEGLAFVRL
jgi:hypothetical protein